MKTEKGVDLTVIRDFGAYSASLTPFLKKEADNMATDGRLKDAVLSHAHKDHCNGFEFLHEHRLKQKEKSNGPPFRRAYIPYLRYNDAKDLGAMMLKVGVQLLCLLSSHNKSRDRITNWIRMVPIMYDLSEHLVPVHQGVDFLDWEPKGKVLWPPKPRTQYYEDLIINLQNIENRLHYWVRQAANGTPDIAYEEIRKVLIPLVSQAKPALQTSATAEIDAILSPYISSCKKAIVSTEARKIAKETYVEYKPTIDNHSIVFSLGAEKEGDGALFLSDLDGDTMDKMCQTINLNMHYKLIKSAHHGTRLGKQFATSVKADTVVHCCGFGNNRYYGPDPAYTNIAITNIVCSDWNFNNPKWQYRSSYNFFNSNKFTITI